MKIKSIIVGLLIIGIILIIGFIYQQGSYTKGPGGKNGGWPLLADTSLSCSGVFGENNILLKFTAAGRMPGPNSTAWIELPAGIEFIDAPMEWKGDLDIGETVNVENRIRATADGNWQVVGKIISYQSGDRVGAMSKLMITVSDGVVVNCTMPTGPEPTPEIEVVPKS
jgi:hypothetical protein